MLALVRFMFERAHRALYAAFDRFPSRKGAAIHIDRFARTLFAHAGGGVLFALGAADLPSHQFDDLEGDGQEFPSATSKNHRAGVEIVRFSEEVPNFLERTRRYGSALSAAVDALEPSLEIAHFRDPWSGVAIALRPGRRYATVFEVNALPSVELPYLFPAVAPATLAKVRAMELACCAASEVIVTPSQTTAGFLAQLGIGTEKIRVIPNGADLHLPHPRPAGAPSRYLLYFGSPQSWQGVDTLLRAFARLADFTDLQLVICGSRQSKAWRRHERLAAKLGVDGRIVWHYELHGAELAGWVQHAAVSVAPLTDSPRNVVQGCAPLKIVESMAAGTAVVASDVPPVRELITDRENGWLVHPDRPGELARALRILLDQPALARRLGEAARATIERDFTWERSTNALRALYGSLDGKGAAADESRERVSLAQR
jgi:glycosyltransferase involved in cell wall biosynthesis